MKKYLWLIPSVLLDGIGFLVASKSEFDGVRIIVSATILFCLGFIIITYINYRELRKKYNLFIKSKKGKVCINTNTGVINYKSSTFKLNEITKYQLVKNEKILLSSGVGEAIVGGVLFGGTGAMAGAYVGKREKYVKECILYIETNNILYAGITIPVTEEAGFKICRIFEVSKNK